MAVLNRGFHLFKSRSFLGTWECVSAHAETHEHKTESNTLITRKEDGIKRQRQEPS